MSYSASKIVKKIQQHKATEKARNREKKKQIRRKRRFTTYTQAQHDGSCPDDIHCSRLCVSQLPTKVDERQQK